jgi:hypothetical protein
MRSAGGGVAGVGRPGGGRWGGLVTGNGEGRWRAVGGLVAAGVSGRVVRVCHISVACVSSVCE